jgi:hypothetical protein
MDDLDEFLKGNDEQPVVENETPQAPETQAQQEATPAEVAEPEAKAEGPARDEKGRFAPKGEKEPDVSPTSEEPKLDHAALIGERRRRQEAEDRLREYEARLAQLQQPQFQPQQQGIPDRWEDPEGYDRYLIAQASALAEERAMHAVQTQRIYSSAVAARAKYADYGDAHAVFGEMVQQNPMLFQQMVTAPDPAEFAYQTAKTEMEIRQYGGIDKLVQARVQAELAKAQTPAPAPTPSIPDTLADAQSARGSSAASAFTVPSLDDILRR